MRGSSVFADLKTIWMAAAISEMQTIILEFLPGVLADNPKAEASANGSPDERRLPQTPPARRDWDRRELRCYYRGTRKIFPEYGSLASMPAGIPVTST